MADEQDRPDEKPDIAAGDNEAVDTGAPEARAESGPPAAEPPAKKAPAKPAKKAAAKKAPDKAAKKAAPAKKAAQKESGRRRHLPGGVADPRAGRRWTTRRHQRGRPSRIRGERSCGAGEIHRRQRA